MARHAADSLGEATSHGVKVPPRRGTSFTLQGLQAMEGAALDTTVLVSHQGRAFDDLRAVHLAGGHCKSYAFREAVKKKYGKSLPQWVQEIFLALCPTCTRRLPRKTTSAGHKPIIALLR